MVKLWAWKAPLKACIGRQVLEAEKAVEAAAELAAPLQELMASEEKRGRRDVEVAMEASFRVKNPWLDHVPRISTLFNPTRIKL